MLLLEKLKSQETLTNTERRIADYILNNLTTIPSMSIERLATYTYTSHSAIVRLAKKMGYTGFRDFKVAVSEVVHGQLYAMGAVDANFPFGPSDSTMVIAKKIADLTSDTVKRTFAQLNEELLSQAVDLLSKAERIFLFSRGDSQIRARSFQNKLVKLNKFSIIAEEYTDEAWTAANLTQKDCALFISYRGKVPQYDRMLNYFHGEKIPSVLLTGNPKSPLNRLATCSIVTTQDEYDFLKVGTFSSQIAFEYILDTLFSVLYAKKYQKNLVNLKKKYAILETGILSENPSDHPHSN